MNTNFDTGRIKGVQVRLGELAKNDLIHNWCHLHQLDLDLKKAFTLIEEKFITKLKELMKSLRH